MTEEEIKEVEEKVGAKPQEAKEEVKSELAPSQDEVKPESAPSQDEVREPTGYVSCPLCDWTGSSQGMYAHFARAHPTESYDEYKPKFGVVTPPGGTSTEDEESGVKSGTEKEEESIYKGEVKATVVLRGILEKHPDISDRQLEEIMDWARFSEIPPHLLTELLMGMKGMNNHTARLIGYKYQLALNTLSGEKPPNLPPLMGLPQQGTSYPQVWPMQYPQTQGYPQNPYPAPPQPVQNLPIAGYPPAQPNPQAQIVPQKTDKPESGLSEERLLAILDERAKRDKEEKKEGALMQTLGGMTQALDNLNSRISSVEQGAIPAAKEEGDTYRTRMEDLLFDNLSSNIKGPKYSEDDIRKIAKDSVPSAPSGSRNEFDMRVEQAQHEAGARKIEAEEHRKGYEAIAGGIKDGFQSLGFNLGAGLAAGPQEQPPDQATPPTRQDAPPVRPVKGKDGMPHTNCPYCNMSLIIPEGQATASCPGCNGIIRVLTREEVAKSKKKQEPKKLPKPEPKKEPPKKEKPEGKPDAEHTKGDKGPSG